MDELKSRLLNARQEQDISLEEISEETKIQVRILKALEDGDFSVFAGEVYLKGVLRNYSKVVGLDPDEMIGLYNQLRKQEMSPREEEKKAKERIVKPRKEGFPAIFTLIIILAVILIGSLFFLIVQGGNGGNNAGGEHGEEPVDNNNGDDSSTVDEPGDNNGEKNGENNGENRDEVKVNLVSSSSTESFWQVEGDDNLRLIIEITGTCWIDLRGPGISFRSRTFRSGEKIDITARDSIWIRLGHPAGVKLYMNGFRIEDIENKRDPVNLTFTLEK